MASKRSAVAKAVPAKRQRDGGDFVNDQAIKGDCTNIPVPAHCLDHSTLSAPLAGALDEPATSAEKLRLSAAQVAHFEEHGWVANVRVLSDADVAKLKADWCAPRVTK